VGWLEKLKKNSKKTQKIRQMRPSRGAASSLDEEGTLKNQR
jgi:hypothetical protein